MNHSSLFSLKLSPTQAYESFYEKFETFSLTFHFLTPKERAFHCSRDIVLRTKQTHTYTYYKIIQIHLNYIHHHDNPIVDINSLTPNTHHRFFLTSHIALKILIFKASSATMIPSPRCIYSVS